MRSSSSCWLCGCVALEGFRGRFRRVLYDAHENGVLNDGISVSRGRDVGDVELDERVLVVL